MHVCIGRPGGMYAANDRRFVVGHHRNEPTLTGFEQSSTLQSPSWRIAPINHPADLIVYPYICRMTSCVKGGGKTYHWAEQNCTTGVMWMRFVVGHHRNEPTLTGFEQSSTLQSPSWRIAPINHPGIAALIVYPYICRMTSCVKGGGKTYHWAEQNCTTGR